MIEIELIRDYLYETIDHKEVDEWLEPIEDEIKKLKQAIDIMIREKMKPAAFLGTLRTYKECYKVDMPYERACILLDCDINKEEYELLKEVLENE